MECASRLERHPPGGVQCGYTLLELVVVTSLIAILAAIALPGLNPQRDEALELAAETVAEAIRFAQAEAARTGITHILVIDRDLEEVSIGTADLSGATAVAVTAAIHPISKQPYRLVLPDQPGMGGVDVTDRAFDYPSGGRQEAVLFDPRGLPFMKASDETQLLTLGEVELELNGRRRSVFVAPFTGRVTLE